MIRRGRGVKKITKYVYLIISLVVIGSVFFIGLFAYYIAQIPDPSVIASRKVNESTKIYDNTGQSILYDIHAEEKRTIIPWDQVPESIKKATLVLEDKDFYSHSAVDVRGIFRAFYKNISTLSISQGGSTITQQLIKKSLLGDEKTVARKIKELALSIGVERKFSKDQIFWMYLNQIPYGSNAYGIEAASQTFFRKPAKDLDVAESALLASLPNAPSYYSPYGNHFKELINRRDGALLKMKELGFISSDEYQRSVKEAPNIKPPQENISAPHFVIMVKDYLVKKYGEDMVEKGGLSVVTTLDSDMQKIAEDVVVKYGKINAEKYRAGNAALVAADPKTGKILALVGSRDYFNISNDGNFNVALAFRQPGSSFKPFAYAGAFTKGFTDSTVLFDVKTEFNPSCAPSGNQETSSTGQECYHPRNYDGNFRGPVTMRQALAQSLNVPSVKTLYLAGIDDTIDLAHRMGITTLNDRSQLGLSLVLGGGEVRLIDMVNAYGVFANDGVHELNSFIEKIVSADGTILEEYQKDESRVLDPQISRLITDILSDNNARSPIFGFNNSLHIPGRQVAAKTGTTQENRDGWVLGFSPSLVAGVWTGNNDNSPMTKQGAGISAAGPMWQEFMIRSLADNQPEEFTKPDPVTINKTMLDGSYNGPQGIHSILFYVNKDDPQGDEPVTPTSDPQFNNWESAVLRWLGGNSS